MVRFWQLILFMIVSETVSGLQTGAVTQSPKGKLSDSIRKSLTENATFLKKPQLARSLRALDESFEIAPFWANRGRRSLEQHWTNLNSETNKQQEISNKYWSGLRNLNQENSLENIPFWANRGKRMVEFSDENLPFWANRGKRYEMESLEDLPFWANRGRRSVGNSEEQIPFWAHRGKRDLDEIPFWANRGRRAQMFGDDSLEEGPFWANRGRRKRQGVSKSWPLSRLFAEEPSWIVLNRREEPSNMSREKFPSKNAEPFWESRGYATNRIGKSVSKNELESEEAEPFWGVRGKRVSINQGQGDQGESWILKNIPWQFARLESISDGPHTQEQLPTSATS